MGNFGASRNNSSHAESNWHLNELMERAVTIEVESLFQNLATRIKKDEFQQR